MGAVQACTIWFHAWLLGRNTWPTNQSHRNAGKARNKIKKYERDGKPVTCEYYKIQTHWFVVLASGSTYCDNCMEKYGWQHLSAGKGSYHENKILEWLKNRLSEEASPYRTTGGGEYRGDILIDIGEDQLVVEAMRIKAHSPAHFLERIETWLSIDAKQVHQNLY